MGWLRSAAQRGAQRYRGLRGVGQRFEDAAARHLEGAGYRILERNYRTKVGEIDFVAEDGEILCFVEVKARRTPAWGPAAEAVTGEKQRRIWNAAQLYLRTAQVRPVCRFDVVAIDTFADTARVQILRGAFEGPPRAQRPR